MRAKLIADTRCLVGEGPIWIRRLSKLLWTDLLDTHLHLFQPATSTWETVETADPVMTAVDTSGGRLVIATATTVALADASSGARPLIVLPNSAVRFNDGKVDHGGRRWIGSMSTTGLFGRGHLYRVDNGIAEIALSCVSVSNGLGWSPDGLTMYVTDSATGRVDAFDFDPIPGTISRRRRFVAIDPAAGRPDGLAVDVDGGVWIALWGASRVERFDPFGRPTDRVEVPVRNVTSCAFGGLGLDRLYITTAAVTGTADERARGAGGLFEVDPHVSGLPVGRYRDHRIEGANVKRAQVGMVGAQGHVRISRVLATRFHGKWPPCFAGSGHPVSRVMATPSERSSAAPA